MSVEYVPTPDLMTPSGHEHYATTETDLSPRKVKIEVRVLPPAGPGDEDYEA